MSVKTDTGAFAMVPEWLLDESGVSDGAIRLYAVLARHADKATGEAVPSRGKLATRLGCSVDTIDRRTKELTDAGALAVSPRRDDAGDRTSNLYTLFRVRLGGRTDAATGGRKNAAVKRESQFEREGSTAPPGAAPTNGPNPEVGRLVAGYVEDYECERNGKSPPRAWRGAAGKAIERALQDHERTEDIAEALGIIAHEGKQPGALPHVLADYHARRPRRSYR